MAVSIRIACYHIAQPLRFHTTVGKRVDEVALYQRFTFAYHADWLIAFFRQVIATKRQTAGRGGALPMREIER